MCQLNRVTAIVLLRLALPVPLLLTFNTLPALIFLNMSLDTVAVHQYLEQNNITKLFQVSIVGSYTFATFISDWVY